MMAASSFGFAYATPAPRRPIARRGRLDFERPRRFKTNDGIRSQAVLLRVVS